jgi:hypothetical protein
MGYSRITLFKGSRGQSNFVSQYIIMPAKSMEMKFLTAGQRKLPYGLKQAIIKKKMKKMK